MRTHGLPRPLFHAVPRTPVALLHGARHGRWALALSLLVVFSGCAVSSYRWVKDGLSTSLADAKYASCQRDAELAPYSATETEEERTLRIRRQSQLCMKADGWSLTRSEGSGSSSAGPASSGDSEPPAKREIRLAQVSAPAAAKSSDKPSSPAEDKKIVKEVTAGAPADDGGDDDGE